MIVFTLLLVGVFALDLATKTLVRARMPLGQEIPLLPFFSLTHVQNTGIAFGLFQNRNPFLIIVGVAVMAGLVRFAIRLYREDPVSGCLIGMILGGALGNMLDRALRGQVTDFLDFFVGAHHWPIFNVADSAICVGVTLLLLRNLFSKKPAPPDHSSSADGAKGPENGASSAVEAKVSTGAPN